MSVATAVLLVATGCGSDQEVVTGGGANDPAPGSTVVDGPGPVIILEQGGGFLPTGQAFRSVPLAVVYEDGTTLSPAATVAIYPGPALPAVTEGQIDDDEVDQLVTAAEEAGLLDDSEEDFGEPSVVDAATTSVTVVTDGTAHVTPVYALDGTGEELPGITPGQHEARQRVGRFVDLVSSTVVDAGGEQYVAERYRVLALAPDLEVDPSVESDTRDWPFPEVVLEEGECTAISRDQADELREALDGASEITRWQTKSGESFVLSVRPVLPHEPGCPG